jgi:HEAT repeat protein
MRPIAAALENGPVEVRVAAARALGSAGAAAEPLLIAALDGPLEVRVAAAEALGHVGSAAAVLPLQETAEHTVRSGDLRKAVREAVAAIQSRLTGATPGQLTLAQGDEGQLSIAEEPGRLSVADRDDEPC